jgi:hypothetical protein
MFKKAMLPTPFRSITTEAALAHNPQKDIEPQCTLILPSISGNSKSIGRNSGDIFLMPLVKQLLRCSHDALIGKFDNATVDFITISPIACSRNKRCIFRDTFFESPPQNVLI